MMSEDSEAKDANQDPENVSGPEGSAGDIETPSELPLRDKKGEGSDEGSKPKITVEGPETPKPEDMARRLMVSMRSHSGPLPPPEVMAGYQILDPNFPDRIIKMAESTLDHDRHIEKETLKLERHRINKHYEAENNRVDSQFKYLGRGQIFALSITVLFLLAGFILIVLGFHMPGTVLGSVGGLGTVVSLGKMLIQGSSRTPSNQKNTPPKDDEEPRKQGSSQESAKGPA